MNYLILIILLTIQIFAKDYNKVLFISSYHASFPTIDKQIEGITEVLDKKNYQVDIEFMDTKRIAPQMVEPIFYNTLKMKKQLLNKYDAILVGDDNALSFIKKYQNEFFYKKPIIFFAINNISFAEEMAKNDYITGIKEVSSIKETLKLIKSFHPKNNKILTIIDNTNTAKGIVKSFDKKILEKVELLNVSNYSYLEFAEKLKNIKNKQPILFISSAIDKNSNIKSFYSSLKFIKKNIDSPIYHFYEHGIGDGLLGGKVVMFKEQGKQAANLVHQVLNGKDIKSITLSKTENKYLFDYKELVKYNLLDKIPKNSILVNKHNKFLDQPLVNILLEILFIFVLVFLWIIYLLIKLNKNSKQLIKKSNEQTSLLSLFEKGDTVLFKWINDKEWSISYVSTNVINLLEYTKEEFLKKDIVYYNCIHKDDIQRVSKEVKLAEENKKDFFRHTPYRLVTKNKEVKWVLDYTVPIINEQGEITHFLGYLLDITKEKRIQDTLEKLIDSQNSIIVLSNGKRLSYANKKFYEFFKCSSIPEFHDKYKSLSSLFIENDRFFHLGKINKNEFWMKKIQNFPENERVVAIPDLNLNICAFSINANKFDENLYLISFTDISKTMINQIELEEKVTRDKLTGAFNREYFDNNYNKLIEDCKSTNTQLALSILDIDLFKNINDTYGHDVGDSVLIEFVHKINEISREDDILCRWGGEEFILLLKLKSKDILFKVLDNIRIKIQNHQFKHIESLTCSIGVTVYKTNEEIEETIKRADKALYKAKENGRNLTICDI